MRILRVDPDGPHRGHRIGLLTKAAMLEWMATAEPQLERIETNNAAVNSSMISVNEALGVELSEPQLPVLRAPSRPSRLGRQLKFQGPPARAVTNDVANDST